MVSLAVTQVLKAFMFSVPLQWLNQLRKVTQVGLDGVRRLDWHDYEAIRRDAARMGRYKLFADAAVFQNICSVLAEGHTHTYTKALKLCCFSLNSLEVDFSLILRTSANQCSKCCSEFIIKHS